MKNRIAHCGLDCEKCDAYLATIHDDQALREKTAKLWACLLYTSPWRLSFKDDGAYTTWLSEMAGRSVIETDVTVTSSDKVLTLSTCTPGGTSRFIVMGKLAAVND